MIDNYKVLNDFSKEELIEIVINLDKLVEQQRVAMRKSMELNNKLLDEVGYKGEKLHM